jgi:hypothetical protein
MMTFEAWMNEYDGLRTRKNVMSNVGLVEHWKNGVSPLSTAKKNDDLEWDGYCQGEDYVWQGMKGDE